MLYSRGYNWNKIRRVANAILKKLSFDGLLSGAWFHKKALTDEVVDETPNVDASRTWHKARALQFDNAESVVVSNFQLCDSASSTWKVEFEFIHTYDGNGGYLFDTRYSNDGAQSPSNGAYIQFINNTFSLSGSGGGFITSQPLTVNVRYYGYLEFNGSILKLFYKGDDGTTETLIADPTQQASGQNFYIGRRHDNTSLFRHLLGWMRITQDNIVTAEYAFEEGEGTTCYNRVMNNFHGTINNATISTFRVEDVRITNGDQGTFLNTDGYSPLNLFTSDYSSGGVAEPTRSNFTVTINETKEGKTECLKAVWDGTSAAQLFKFNFLPIEQGVTFDISAEFYLEGFTGVRMGANGNFGSLNSTTNDWETYSQTITVNNTNDDLVISLNGGASGSTIWLKNIVVTQPNIYVPRLKDNTTDVLGNPLTYKGQVAQPLSLVNSNGGSYLSAGEYLNISSNVDVNSFTQVFLAKLDPSLKAFDDFRSIYGLSSASIYYLQSDQVYFRANGQTTPATIWSGGSFADEDFTGWQTMFITRNFDTGEITAHINGKTKNVFETDSLGEVYSVGSFGQSNNQFFAGEIAYSALYNRVLTAQEIANWDPYNAPQQGLELFHAYTVGSGSTVFDVSGNNNHGTITNATLSNFWIKQDQFHWNLKKGFSEVYSFDGVDDNITLDTPLAFTGDFFIDFDVFTLSNEFYIASSGGEYLRFTGGSLLFRVDSNLYTITTGITTNTRYIGRLQRISGVITCTLNGVNHPVVTTNTTVDFSFFGSNGLSSGYTQGITNYINVNNEYIATGINFPNATINGGLQSVKVPYTINGNYTNPAGKWHNDAETEINFPHTAKLHMINEQFDYKPFFYKNAQLEDATAAYSMRKVIGDYEGPLVNVIRSSDLQARDFYPDSRGDLDTTAITNFVNESGPVLDDYAGAAAAYSLRKLRTAYTGSAIEVRRSSNGDTQDIGFDSNGDLDTTALLDFVNADVVLSQSDFSSGGSDFAYLNGYTQQRGLTFASRSNVTKLTVSNSGNTTFGPILNQLPVGVGIKLNFSFYIPSTNDAANQFQQFNSNTYLPYSSSLTDQWVDVEIRGTSNSDDVFFRLRDDGDINLPVEAIGDVVYMSNVTVTQTYDNIDEDFSSDLGWTFFNGTSNISGGTLNFNTSTNDYAFCSYGAIPNQVVDIEFTISNYVSGGIFMINFGGGYSSPTYSANQTVTLTNVVISSNGNQNWGFRAFGSFVGSIDNFKVTVKNAEGAVTTWYDQTQNDPLLQNNATQSDPAEMPLVVSAGTVVTETNGLPAISWESNNLALLRIPWNATSSQSWFGVFNPLNDSYIAISEIPAGGRRDWVVQSGSTSTSLNGFNNQQGTLFINSEEQSPTTRDDLHTAFSTQGNVLASTIDLDNSTWNDGSDWYFFGNGGGVGNLFNYSGRVQEWIVFESDQSTNRTGIEGNIGRYYNIDGFTDGRVATWYDQANANHATQSTPDEQPLIVSDGALVLENSKPAIDFDGVDDYFDTNLGTLTELSVFMLFRKTNTGSNGIFGGTGTRSLGYVRENLRHRVFYVNTTAENITDSRTTPFTELVSFFRSETATTIDLFRDGSNKASLTSLGSTLQNPTNLIGKLGGLNPYHFEGLIQELIFFDSADQSENRQDIEKNIADYYEITLSGNSGVESWVKNVSFADMYQIWFDYEYLHRLFANFEIPNQVNKILAYSDELTADQRQQVYDYLQKNYHPIYTAFSNRVLADGGTVENLSCGTTKVEYLLNNP
jgi:hypothetical protein